MCGDAIKMLSSNCGQLCVAATNKPPGQDGLKKIVTSQQLRSRETSFRLMLLARPSSSALVEQDQMPLYPTEVI